MDNYNYDFAKRFQHFRKRAGLTQKEAAEALGYSSHGSIYKFCQIFSGACEPEIASIKEKLLASRKLCTDATNVTTNGHRSYIRNFSTSEAVLHVPMQRKTLAELQTIDVLVAFMGVLVHDHETALYHFGSGHAECIAHLLRYLIKNTQETGNDWSQGYRSP